MSAIEDTQDDSPIQHTEPEPDPGTLRNFSQFLQNVEDGQLHHELTEHLEDIIAALGNYVIDHGGKPKAEIDLKVSIALEDGELRITPALKVKKPLAPRRTTTMWANARNQPTLANPKQTRMFARGLRDDSGPARTVE